MKRPALWTLRLYKAVLSPYMPGMCRFQPTCSEYASEAIGRFGTLRGMAMAARRLSKCQPWRSGGYDPVPEPKQT